MNWNKGFTARYYIDRVNPQTWKDEERIEIINGSINRSEGKLQESASVLCRNFDSSREIWIRIYLDAIQGGNSEHVALFTGLTSTPEENINGNITEYPVSCYSVLKPVDDIDLPRGWYAPAEANGASLIKDLLKATPAPVTIEGESPNLQKAIIAEDNETRLTMIHKILDAINWQMRIMGDGQIILSAKPITISERFDAIDNDSIEPKVTKKRDWFNCPNVLRVIIDDLTSIARDDSESSLLSTVNRGREVWATETNGQLNSGEGIAEYARRRLRELQSVGMSISYDRRYRPNLLVGDIVRLHYPKQRIDGKFKIISQSIELGYGATTSEEVVEI